jgi:hypothetical protein
MALSIRTLQAMTHESLRYRKLTDAISARFLANKVPRQMENRWLLR